LFKGAQQFKKWHSLKTWNGQGKNFIDLAMENAKYSAIKVLIIAVQEYKKAYFIKVIKNCNDSKTKVLIN